VADTSQSSASNEENKVAENMDDAVNKDAAVASDEMRRAKMEELQSSLEAAQEGLKSARARRAKAQTELKEAEAAETAAAVQVCLCVCMCGCVCVCVCRASHTPVQGITHTHIHHTPLCRASHTHTYITHTQ
jgi:hypothetical protein